MRAVVVGDHLIRWSTTGYAATSPRPASGAADVLTPSVTVEVMRHGYVPQVHPDHMR